MFLENEWTEFLALVPMLGNMGLLEKRIENDANGNQLYVGYARKPKTPTSSAEWMIRKFSYDANNFLEYDQLPDDGIGFKYSWDDRSNAFT